MRYKEFKESIEKLKKNKENISEELLKTKYKRAYNELKMKIKESSEEILLDALLSVFVWGKEAVYSSREEAVSDSSFVSSINQFLQIQKQCGFFKRVGNVLFKEFDVEAFMDLAIELQMDVVSWRKGGLARIMEDNLMEINDSLKRIWIADEELSNLMTSAEFSMLEKEKKEKELAELREYVDFKRASYDAKNSVYMKLVESGQYSYPEAASTQEQVNNPSLAASRLEERGLYR